MELALVKGIGILFVAIGITALFNSKIFAKMSNEFKRGVYLLYLSGFTILFFGIFILVLNVPIDWKTWVIEVIGWLGILKGLFLMITPSTASKFYSGMLPNKGLIIFLGIVALVLGLILLL